MRVAKILLTKVSSVSSHFFCYTIPLQHGLLTNLTPLGAYVRLEMPVKFFREVSVPS